GLAASVLKNSYFFSLCRLSAKQRRNLSFTFSRTPVNQGEVFLPNPPVLELPYQVQICTLAFCDDESPGGILVQAVNDSGPKRGPLNGQARTMGEQSMHERPFAVACPWMDHKARRLVHDEKVLVFEKNVQAHRFGLENLICFLSGDLRHD